MIIGTECKVECKPECTDAEPEFKPDPKVAGALFDFLGFLTTRDDVSTFGSSEECSTAVDLLKEWANIRNLSLDSADVENWHQHPC